MLSPLHAITSPNTCYVLTNTCLESFDKVKNNLIKLSVIYLLRADKQIYATTDSCISKSISYSLWQDDTILGKLVPIKHNSHKLSNAEKTYDNLRQKG